MAAPAATSTSAGQNDHNQFLVTMGHAMGVPGVNKVGDLGGEGPVAGRPGVTSGIALG